MLPFERLCGTRYAAFDYRWIGSFRNLFSGKRVVYAKSRRTLMTTRSPRRRTGEYRRILCPIDFSVVADVGVEHAVHLAARHRAALVLLHVYPPVAIYAPPEVAGSAMIRSDEAWRAEAQQELCRVRDRIRQTGAVTHALMVEGYPPEQIARVARRLRCDLIVLATRGHTGLLRLLLGSSVAERVIRRTPCPVLAYRTPQPPQVRGRMRDPLKAAA
jgi:nucleotide-binding universal stress UspA family protein